MKFYSIFLISLIVISCSSKTDKKPVLLQNENSSDDDKMTILTDSADVSLVAGKIFNMWKPDEKDLIVVDSLLISAIQKGEFDFIKDPKLQLIYNYYRQYICYNDHNGEKLIYVNALCKILDRPVEVDGEVIMEPYDWKNRLLIFNDGGPCFWNMTLNLTTKTYSKVYANGY